MRQARCGVDGVSLGTTLLVVALVVTISFALASLSVTHLNLMGVSSNRVQAENLAHSAITQAIEKILAGDGSFGEEQLAGETITVTHSEAPDGAVGLLAFSPTEANSLGLPYSVNNLRGAGSVVGVGHRVVPAAAAHLVGVGRCRGVEKRVECILHVPPFPYAIASSVPIRSVGSLTIAGVTDPGDMLEVVANGTSDPKAVPADLVTNATSAQALVLGGDTVVTGDAQSSGGVELDPDGTKILGEVRTYADPAAIPRIAWLQKSWWP